MKKSQLLELIKNVVREEQDYQQLFKHMLDKVGKSITDMSDDEKKTFFNAVDTAYKAKSEGRLRGYNEAELTAGQKKIDVDKDGEIEGSDLAALRAGKKVDEAKYNFGKDSAPGEWVAYLSMTRGKKLLKTFNSARGAKQFLSKNVDNLLSGSNVESVGIMTKKQWDEREAKYAIEGINEAGTPIDFKWPKGNTSKEIEELEAEYKALIEKGSDILEKQKQLIRKEPLTGEYPWENYDKWPTKLKIEVEKLEREFEKNHEKTTEMGKKLFKLKGFSR
jgi:hypothetical protein